MEKREYNQEERRIGGGDHAHEDGGCHFLLSHPDVVAAVRQNGLSDGDCGALAELFRMFGDPTRLRILDALGISPLCVGDLATLLGMTVSAISHQLRLLRGAALVTARREGKAMVYSLADDHVRTIMQNGIEHIRE